MEYWPTFLGLFLLITALMTLLAALVETCRSAEWNGKVLCLSLLAALAGSYGLLWLVSVLS